MMDATQEAFGRFTVGSEMDVATLAAAAAPGTVGSELTDATVTAVAAAPNTVDTQVNDATMTAAAARGTVGSEVNVDRLVAHMRACPEDAEAQERACAELRHMSVNNAEVKTRAGAAGAVVGRCRLTPGCPPVETVWLKRLKLKHNVSLSSGAFNFNLRFYTVDVVVAAMRAHLQNEGLQRVACGALGMAV